MNSWLIRLHDKKQLVANFGYLSILQLLVLSLPLISYPYLIRVLGFNTYGHVVFAQTTVAYFSIIINYGFNISATKDIAENRDDPERMSVILSSVVLTKFFIWAILLFCLVILIFFVSPFKENKLLYLFSYGACFNELLFQQFFFQGVEKMRYITIVNVISRLFCFILLFFVITEESDYLYVPLLNSLGALLGGSITFYIIICKESISLHFESFQNIKKVFVESTPFFVSRFSSVVVNRTNTMFIGAFIGYSEVAYYDLAQKILSVLLIPFDIVNQVIYPYVVRTKNLQFTKRVVKVVFICALLIYALLFEFKNNIVTILAGPDMMTAIPIIMILGVNVILTSQNYFLGNTSLVVAGHGKEFNKSVIYCSVFYLFGLSVLFFFDIINIYILSVLSVLVELLCFCYRLYYVRYYHLF
ncbi:oligosaccharide flippase family protein [Bacteroides hominis]|uniref:oligosaccharide flippase family protein n=1 Tax=Bacteroides hominis TaxID=2763023 RepID=UPI003D6A0C0B